MAHINFFGAMVSTMVYFGILQVSLGGIDLFVFVYALRFVY